MFREAINYPTNGDRAAVTVLVGGLLTLLGGLSIPVGAQLYREIGAGFQDPLDVGTLLVLFTICLISLLVVLGFFVRVFYFARGRRPEQPTFQQTELLQTAVDGTGALVVLVVYLLVPTVLWVVGGDQGAVESASSQDVLGLARGLAFVANVLALYVLPASLASYADAASSSRATLRRSIRAGFERDGLSTALTSGEYAVGWLRSSAILAFGLLLGATLVNFMLVGGVLAVFVWFYALVSGSYVLGRAYDAARNPSRSVRAPTAGERTQPGFETKWYQRGSGLLLTFLFLVLAFVVIQVSATRQLVVEYPAIADDTGPILTAILWAVDSLVDLVFPDSVQSYLSRDVPLDRNIPWPIYFYSFAGAITYIFMSFITAPDRGSELDALDARSILWKLKNFEPADEPDPQVRELLADVRGWSDEETGSRAGRILARIRQWPTDGQTIERDAEAILAEIHAWEPETATQSTEAGRLLQQLREYRPAGDGPLTEGQQLVRRIQSWSPTEATALTPAERVLVTIKSWSRTRPTDETPLEHLDGNEEFDPGLDGKDGAVDVLTDLQDWSPLADAADRDAEAILERLGSWNPAQSLETLVDADVIDPDEETQLHEAGITTTEQLRNADPDALADVLSGRDSVEDLQYRVEGWLWFDELVEQGILTDRARRRFLERGIDSPKELIGTEGASLMESVLGDRSQMRVREAIADSWKRSTSERTSRQYLDRTTMEMWKFGLRIPAATLLAASAYLFFFHGLEDEFVTAGISFLFGLYVKPVHEAIGGLADRLLGGESGAERESVGPFSRAGAVSGKPWYSDTIGVVLVGLYLVLAIAIVLVSVGDGTDPFPEVPVDVYFYGLFGAVGYVFVSLLNEFEKSFGSLLQTGLRIPAALLLAAGVYLLGTFFSGEIADLTVAQLSLLVGLYVKLTLEMLGNLSNDVLERIR